MNFFQRLRNNQRDTLATRSLAMLSSERVISSNRAYFPARKNTLVVPNLKSSGSQFKANNRASQKVRGSKFCMAGGRKPAYRSYKSLKLVREGKPFCISSNTSNIPPQCNCWRISTPSNWLGCWAMLGLMHRTNWALVEPSLVINSFIWTLNLAPTLT
eukprot:Lithocolla_globosa_v1_NODE_2045_length_2195_cov_5.545794.p3 type:complete len:158 gc:universal NODE_2045_length_2195_cov_5.545794:471-944(+)